MTTTGAANTVSLKDLGASLERVIVLSGRNGRAGDPSGPARRVSYSTCGGA